MKILFCTEEIENPFILANLCRMARASLEKYDNEVYVVSPHNALPKEYSDINHIRIPNYESPVKYKDYDTYLYLKYFKDVSAKKIRSRLQSIEMQLGDLSNATLTVSASPMLSRLS